MTRRTRKIGNTKKGKLKKHGTKKGGATPIDAKILANQTTIDKLNKETLLANREIESLEKSIKKTDTSGFFYTNSNDTKGEKVKKLNEKIKLKKEKLKDLEKKIKVLKKENDDYEELKRSDEKEKMNEDILKKDSIERRTKTTIEKYKNKKKELEHLLRDDENKKLNEEIQEIVNGKDKDIVTNIQFIRDIQDKMTKLYGIPVVLDKKCRIVSKDYPTSLSFLAEIEFLVESKLKETIKREDVLVWLAWQKDKIESYKKSIQTLIEGYTRSKVGNKPDNIERISNLGIDKQIFLWDILDIYNPSMWNNLRNSTIRVFLTALKKEKTRRKDLVNKCYLLSDAELLNLFKTQDRNETSILITKLISYLYPIKHTKGLQLFLRLLCILLYNTYSSNPIALQENEVIPIQEVDYVEFKNNVKNNVKDNQERLESLMSGLACSESLGEEHLQLFCTKDLKEKKRENYDQAQYLVDILNLIMNKNYVLNDNKGTFDRDMGASRVGMFLQSEYSASVSGVGSPFLTGISGLIYVGSALGSAITTIPLALLGIK